MQVTADYVTATPAMPYPGQALVALCNNQCNEGGPAIEGMVALPLAIAVVVLFPQEVSFFPYLVHVGDERRAQTCVDLQCAPNVRRAR